MNCQVDRLHPAGIPLHASSWFECEALIAHACVAIVADLAGRNMFGHVDFRF